MTPKEATKHEQGDVAPPLGELGLEHHPGDRPVQGDDQPGDRKGRQRVAPHHDAEEGASVGRVDLAGGGVLPGLLEDGGHDVNQRRHLARRREEPRGHDSAAPQDHIPAGDTDQPPRQQIGHERQAVDKHPAQQYPVDPERSQEPILGRPQEGDQTTHQIANGEGPQVPLHAQVRADQEQVGGHHHGERIDEPIGHEAAHVPPAHGRAGSWP